MMYAYRYSVIYIQYILTVMCKCAENYGINEILKIFIRIRKSLLILMGKLVRYNTVASSKIENITL